MKSFVRMAFESKILMTRALIVDGPPNLRLLYGLFLSQLNLKVESCPDFPALMAQLAQDNLVDVIFLNLTYPFEKGLACVGQIHRLYPEAIIVVICNVKDGVEAEAISQGARGFLYTPVSKRDFEKILQQLQHT